MMKKQLYMAALLAACGSGLQAMEFPEQKKDENCNNIAHVVAPKMIKGQIQSLQQLCAQSFGKQENTESTAEYLQLFVDKQKKAVSFEDKQELKAYDSYAATIAQHAPDSVINNEYELLKKASSSEMSEFNAALVLRFMKIAPKEDFKKLVKEIACNGPLSPEMVKIIIEDRLLKDELCKDYFKGTFFDESMMQHGNGQLLLEALKNYWYKDISQKFGDGYTVTLRGNKTIDSDELDNKWKSIFEKKARFELKKNLDNSISFSDGKGNEGVIPAGIMIRSTPIDETTITDLAINKEDGLLVVAVVNKINKAAHLVILDMARNYQIVFVSDYSGHDITEFRVFADADCIMGAYSTNYMNAELFDTTQCKKHFKRTFSFDDYMTFLGIDIARSNDTKCISIDLDGAKVKELMKEMLQRFDGEYCDLDMMFELELIMYLRCKDIRYAMGEQDTIKDKVVAFKKAYIARSLKDPIALLSVLNPSELEGTFFNKVVKKVQEFLDRPEITKKIEEFFLAESKKDSKDDESKEEKE